MCAWWIEWYSYKNFFCVVHRWTVPIPSPPHTFFFEKLDIAVCETLLIITSDKYHQVHSSYIISRLSHSVHMCYHRSSNPCKETNQSCWPFNLLHTCKHFCVYIYSGLVSGLFLSAVFLYKMLLSNRFHTQVDGLNIRSKRFTGSPCLFASLV